MIKSCFCGASDSGKEAEKRTERVAKSDAPVSTGPCHKQKGSVKAAPKDRSGQQNVHAMAGSSASADGSSPVSANALRTPNDSSTPTETKPARTATLQELSSKYQRGVFDPNNPTGRLETKRVEWNSNSTTSPKTPELPDRRSSRTQEELETGSEYDEKNIFSTRSTLSNATSARPTPVSELQNLLGVPGQGLQSVEADPIHSIQSQASSERTNTGSQSPWGRSSSDHHSTRHKSHHKHSRRSKDSKDKHKTVGQAVRESLLRQQSFGLPIASTRQPADSYHTILPSSDSGQLEGHPYFEVVGRLSGGTSGHVLICLDQRTKEKVVVKMLARGVTNAKAAEREIANLRLCAMHPYIIHMREVFLTSAHLAIAMDFAGGGNLATYIELYQSSKVGKGISEERARLIFQQIVVAIEFCHTMGFANRDIKLENVLLVNESEDKAAIPIVKLSDFGFSKDEFADSVCKTACGTPECVAPEVLAGGLYDGKYSDIWSMGVLLYAMLTGNYPFSRPSDKQLDTNGSMRKLFGRIMGAKYAMPQHISREAQDLLQCVLKVNPEERMSIVDVLKHPFFISHSRKAKIVSVNHSLLQVPDSMLTGFFNQTDEQISQILKQASRGPGQQVTMR